MTSRDALVVVYLAVFSTGLTFWLLQRANGVLSPAQVTAYGYLAPFVAMLLLFVTEPDRIGWHWLPGSLLVITDIALLRRGDVRPRPPLPVRSAENCALC
jgi:drug/metabolite transporter (DMT)-like permease